MIYFGSESDTPSCQNPRAATRSRCSLKPCRSMYRPTLNCIRLIGLQSGQTQSRRGSPSFWLCKNANSTLSPPSSRRTAQPLRLYAESSPSDTGRRTEPDGEWIYTAPHIRPIPQSAHRSTHSGWSRCRAFPSWRCGSGISGRPVCDSSLSATPSPSRSSSAEHTCTRSPPEC